MRDLFERNTNSQITSDYVTIVIERLLLLALNSSFLYSLQYHFYLVLFFNRKVFNQFVIKKNMKKEILFLTLVLSCWFGKVFCQQCTIIAALTSPVEMNLKSEGEKCEAIFYFFCHF